MRGSQPVSARARAAKVTSQSTAISAAPASMSCEPTCAWMPSVSGARRSASSASSGGQPELRAVVAGADVLVRVGLDARA